MRILFTLIPEKGHINPYIPVAQLLQDAAHTVAFYSACDISEQLKNAGFSNFLGMKVVEQPSLNRGKYFADKIKDKIWLRNWIKELLITNTPAQVPVLKDVITQWKPDLIISDPMLYPAIISSILLNIPCVSISNSLNPVLNQEVESELLETVNWIKVEREELFNSYGITNQKFSGCDWISPDLAICFSTPEFTKCEIKGVNQVGASYLEKFRGDEVVFPFDKLDSHKKKILVSFGSQIYFQPEMFKKVISSLSNPEYQLIISVNELKDSEIFNDLPKDSIVEKYIPQMKVLPFIDVFITHGGANSVMEALYHAVPMIISPICNDQFHQAWFLNQANCGVTLDVNLATPSVLEKSVQRCLKDSELKSNLHIISESYKKNNGARKTVQLIENFWEEYAN